MNAAKKAIYSDNGIWDVSILRYSSLKQDKQINKSDARKRRSM